MHNQDKEATMNQMTSPPPALPLSAMQFASVDQTTPDPMAYLHCAITLGPATLRVFAIAVERDELGLQRGASPCAARALDKLYCLCSPAQEFETVAMNGRDYVIWVEPSAVPAGK